MGVSALSFCFLCVPKRCDNWVLCKDSHLQVKWRGVLFSQPESLHDLILFTLDTDVFELAVSIWSDPFQLVKCFFSGSALH